MPGYHLMTWDKVLFFVEHLKQIFYYCDIQVIDLKLEVENLIALLYQLLHIKIPTQWPWVTLLQYYLELIICNYNDIAQG